MNWNIKLHQFPSAIKGLIFSFILVMLFGYAVSFSFLKQTTNLSTKGIVENYNGNEENEEAEEIKFKKSIYEMKTTIHNHLFSMAVIFFITGGLLYFTSVKLVFKSFLMIEPFISLIITFASLLLMWNGILFMKYVTILSGIVMHLSFFISLLIIFRELVFIKTEH